MVVIAAWGPLALAQPADPHGDPQPLAGPTVVDQREATLGDRAYDGSMPALTAPAPESTLDLLDLSEGEQRRVSAILGERAAVWDRAVADNFESLQLFQAAEAEGDRLAQFSIVWGFLSSLEPLSERPLLEVELRSALEPQNQGEYDAILARYGSERLAHARAEAERTGTAFKGVEFALEGIGKTLELEIGRAFERRLSDGSMWLEMIVRELDLSADQDQMVRGMAADYFDEVGLDPTEAEQEAFFIKLLMRLRPDQAAELLKLVRGS